MSEKTTISIDKDLVNILIKMCKKNESYNSVLRKLITEEPKKLITEEPKEENFKSAKVSNSGTASISRHLAGKTIEYRIKPE